MAVLNKTRWMTSALALAWCVSVSATSPVTGVSAGLVDEDLNPEGSSGYVAKPEVSAPHAMVVTAHPLATQAGDAVLRQGGSAVDAVIAAQMMLNLVEPQASGIGGGAFLMYYDAEQQRLHAYDGRETAASAATPDMFLQDGEAMAFFPAVNSGLSVGVPGVLRLLELAHHQHGKRPWASLFAPAIQQAEHGFPVGRRLHLASRDDRDLASQPAAAQYFLDEQGQAWPVGHVLKNPQLADSFRQIAQQGADAFYLGPIARDMVEAVKRHPVPGRLTRQDLADYQALERDPLCGAYRDYQVCGMPPPSSTVTLLQMLGMLQHLPMGDFAPVSVDAVHYFSEAGRLAHADRDRYVADPDFIDVPTQGLLDTDYLRARADLIQPQRSMGQALAGSPPGSASGLGLDQSSPYPSTSHLVAVDAQGNVASMTTTIEFVFGSRIFVRGFLLNNEMTDFARDPRDHTGRWVANRIEPGKRPRSAMSPVVVFKQGRPYLAVGSPGGSAIINYIAKTLVGVMDWGLGIQQAIALPNFGSRNRQTEIEAGTALEALITPLAQRGHDVGLREFPSGLHGVLIQSDQLRGGADPRREGVAVGH